MGGRSGERQSHHRGPSPWKQRGQNVETTLTISLEDAYHGKQQRFSLETIGENGRPASKSYTVKIPPGTTDGKIIRLANQGGKGTGGGANGDLRLKVRIKPHPEYRLEGNDLYVTVPVTPWEAALGGRIQVKTLDGSVTISIPPGTQSGKKMRLREKGLPAKAKKRGHLYAEIRIAVPPTLSKEERELFEKLAEESKFNPRKE